jgi:adenylyltransferase/sulfurtransferase
MPIIHIPNLLRPYVAGQADVTVTGATVGAAMEDLVTRYPAFRPHLYKADGSLRPFVNLFLEGKNVRDLQGLATPLEETSVLTIVPSIAGG